MELDFTDSDEPKPSATLGESESATDEPLSSINDKLDAILAALGVSYKEESNEKAAD